MKNCSHFAYTNNLHHNDFDYMHIFVIKKNPSFKTLVYLLTTNMITLHSFLRAPSKI